MGAIHPLLVNRLLSWSRKFPGDQISFYFTFKVAPVDRARNQIVHFFLAHDFTHLLMIDSDTIPPENAVHKLLAADTDAISAMTGILRINEEGEWEVYDNCFIERETDPETGKVTKTILAEQHTGLQRIFRCGAACLMIKREVFEKLTKPYFRFILTDDGLSHKVSEDIYFCDTLHAAGVELWADTDVICQHQKDIII